MCGAFEQHNKAMHEWAAILHDWPDDAASRLNIRPSLTAGTIDAEGYRERSWSLLPRWAKEPKLKFSTFNARAEGIENKPAFRDAWKRSQRCVVPASRYFEWPTIDGKKQCHAIAPQTDRALLLGGLWEIWEAEGERKETFTIITTAASPDIAWIHHRSPLILFPGELNCWLSGSPEDAAKLLQPKAESGLGAQAIDSPTKTA